MLKTKVSIVMAFYNCEQFIEEALCPLRHLDPEIFEFIAINDCSTDESMCIVSNALRDFTTDYTLINTFVNDGCFKARTKAIEASRGKYIAIVDADDIICKNRLKRQLEVLENDENIFCCGSFAQKIDQEGRDIEIMDYPPPTTRDIIDKIESDHTCNPIIDPTTMFRRSVFDELGGYSFKNDRNLVADMDLWFRALLSDKKFVNIQEPIIKYRVNPKGNTVSYKKEMIRQHVRVRNEFIKGFKRVCLE